MCNVVGERADKTKTVCRTGHTVSDASKHSVNSKELGKHRYILFHKLHLIVSEFI